MRPKLSFAALVLPLCILISSCKTIITTQIPFSALVTTTRLELPVMVSSDTCGKLVNVGDEYGFENLLCDDIGGHWTGEARLVDHNTKEMIFEGPVSVYHGTGNNIIIYISKDALRSIREHIDTHDIRIKVSFYNDTNTQQEMYVRGIWVNGRSVGSEGGLLVIPPEAKITLQMSDVATMTLLSSGMESVGMFPVK